MAQGSPNEAAPKGLGRTLVEKLPAPVAAQLILLRRRRPPVGFVRLGSFRRLTPISDDYGFDRGTPIDRFYIDDWLGRFRGDVQYALGDIRGRVLEVGEDAYARRFGGAVESIDVLHVDAANSKATIVGDITREDVLPRATFDCAICLQTLHVIYDFRAALRALHASLRPGGVLLATVPGITRACTPDRDLWGDWWRFTAKSAHRVLTEVFGSEADITVEAYGNVRSATAFLHGLGAGELRREHLELRDPDFEVVIGIRAVRSPA